MNIIKWLKDLTKKIQLYKKEGLSKGTKNEINKSILLLQDVKGLKTKTKVDNLSATQQ
jgi:hypothetical protein